MPGERHDLEVTCGKRSEGVSKELAARPPAGGKGSWNQPHKSLLAPCCPWDIRCVSLWTPLFPRVKIPIFKQLQEHTWAISMDQFINGIIFCHWAVAERFWQLLQGLTFPGHPHGHAAGRGPQVHSAGARAHGQAGLAGIPLETLDRAQLLQHHRQLQLPDVPDPHGVGNVIWRGSSNRGIAEG